MTLEQYAYLADIAGVLLIIASIFYVARQVGQGNALARYQVRQAMMEKDLTALQLEIANPEITFAFSSEDPSEDDLMKMHLFLTHLMRQREWEWFQVRDGIISEDVYRTYHELNAIVLGTTRTREWWKGVGRMGLNPDFVKDVDALLSERGLTNYWDEVRNFLNHQDSTAPSNGPTAATK